MQKTNFDVETESTIINDRIVSDCINKVSAWRVFHMFSASHNDDDAQQFTFNTFECIENKRKSPNPSGYKLSEKSNKIPKKKNTNTYVQCEAVRLINEFRMLSF